MPASRIPLTVIGGFLGAGKTTLLNRLLNDAAGRRIAALVNDFGEINVDSALVEANSGDTIALSNGCVCCSIGDDLSRALIRVLDAPQPFDAVIIEASGVSDPWKIAQIGLADPQLALDAVIVLVDTQAVLAQSRDARLIDTIERQLRAADLLVLNKIDRVDDDERQRVHEWIAAVAGRTPRFEAVQARLPTQLLGALGDPVPRPAPHGECGEAGHAHSHEHDELFESWSIRPEAALSAPALRRLLANMPEGVLRLKGLVRNDELGWCELQYSGRHGALRRAAAPPGGQTAVVAIGLRGCLPRDALERAFAAAGALR